MSLDKQHNQLTNELNEYINHVAELLASENYREKDIKNFLNAIYNTAYDIGAVSERIVQMRGVIDDNGL